MVYTLFYVFLAIFVATATVTLLGITKRINIDKEYLKPLFTALILEVVGAVIALFAAADFFGDSASSFTRTLPIEVRSDSSDVALAKISDMISNNKNLSLQNKTLQASLAEMSVEIQGLKNELGEFDKVKGQVLLLFAQLNVDIGKSTGEFINLSFLPDTKTDVAKRIHQALVAIDATRSMDNDPMTVHRALITYQQRKQFPDATGNFGRMTLSAMINDYLDNVRRGI